MRALPILFALTLFGCHDKDKHEPWYPRYPESWSLTPAGHTRDAGPFASVAAGYATEADLDQAVDAGFQRFHDRLGYLPPNMPVTLNDDYVLWVRLSKASKNTGVWASGIYVSGEPMVHVCIWSRIETADAPTLPVWIARPPGTYWGIYYENWRYTDRPLAPAVAHELLHVSIGDPDHASALWRKLEGSGKAAAGAAPTCEGRF